MELFCVSTWSGWAGFDVSFNAEEHLDQVLWASGAQRLGCDRRYILWSAHSEYAFKERMKAQFPVMRPLKLCGVVG